MFRYLSTTVTYLNDIHDKCTLLLGSEYLSSSFLSKNLTVEINRAIMLLVVLYECKTWYITVRKDHRFRLSENQVIRRISGPKIENVRERQR